MVESAAPPEAPGKLPWDKILAVLLVVAIIVAAWGWLFNPLAAPPEEEPPEPVNTAPTAVGSVDKTIADVGDVFAFDGSGSTDPDTGDSVASWEWNFGDGTIMRETAAANGDGKVNYVYSTSGDYVVVLTVTDTRGASASNDVSLITVKAFHPIVPAGEGAPPFAILGSDKTVIKEGTTVNFDADLSYAWVKNETDVLVPDRELKDVNGTRPADGITKFQWFFGDGTTGTGNTTSHTFARPGSYPVKLTVTTADGRRDLVIKTIRVQEAEAAFVGVIKNPDAYVVATIGEPTTLDPAWDYETAGGGILMQVTEQLIWYDRGNVKELIPWLATNVPSLGDGTIFNDNKSYKFFIRQGVEFHNGATLTAEDVEYSIERHLVRDPVGGPMYLMKEALFGAAQQHEFIPYQYIDAAVVRNDAEQSVTLNLNQSFAPFLQVMAFWVGAILPKDYAIANGDWDGTAADAEAIFGENYAEFWDDNLVGTGPYKFVRWERNVQIILERFDDYWGGNYPGETKRPANLKQYIVKTVPEFSTRKLLLLSGDVDAAYIPIQFEDQVTGQANLRIYRGLRNLVASPFFALNQNINTTVAGGWVGNLPTQYPDAMTGEWLSFFADKNLRLAFSYAFNVSSFIEQIYRGNAQQLASPIPEGLLGFNATSPAPRQFDLAQTEAYLKLAWNDTGNSVWERGFEFDVLYNIGNTARQAMGEIFKANIESLNALRPGKPLFTLNVVGVEWGAVYIPALFSHGLTAFALGWIADYADPHNFMHPFLHSDGFFAFYLGYANATIDQKIEASVAAADDATRIQRYQEAAQIAFDDAVYAFIIQGHGYRVERTWVRDWFHNPMYASTWVWILDKF